jgi:hypothetical protein
VTDSKNHSGECASLEGRLFRPASPAELAEVVELAFDFRGDVTLELTTGGRIEGFVFNRLSAGPRPCLQFFPAREGGSREIPYIEIAAIAFTGKDTASGKSWEAWMAKKESQRRADADEAECIARARGHL